eukprot:6211289-Alexandrium_andersonii.AAC.1
MGPRVPGRLGAGCAHPPQGGARGAAGLAAALPHACRPRDEAPHSGRQPRVAHVLRAGPGEGPRAQ